MTPNEKKLLAKFKVVDRVSVVTISRETGYSINYADSLCQNLVAQGLLEVAAPGRWSVYKIRERFREQPSYQEKKREWGERIKELVEGEQKKEKFEQEREKFEASRLTGDKCTYCKGTGKDSWGIYCLKCEGTGKKRKIKI